MMQLRSAVAEAGRPPSSARGKQCSSRAEQRDRVLHLSTEINELVEQKTNLQSELQEALEKHQVALLEVEEAEKNYKST